MKQSREEKKEAVAPMVPTVDDEQYQTLWSQFEQEAGFGAEAREQETAKLKEEIAMLEARIEEKKQAIAAIEQRETSAKEQMRALIRAKLGPEAILSAMKIEYKVKRAPAPRVPKPSTSEGTSEEDKELVLNHLDAEGLTMRELSKRTEKDSTFLQNVLKVLVDEGKVQKTGERTGARYALAQ
jgi:hypothetical protein